MNEADSAVRGALLQLTSPQVLWALVAVAIAAAVALGVARAPWTRPLGHPKKSRLTVVARLAPCNKARDFSGNRGAGVALGAPLG